MANRWQLISPFKSYVWIVVWYSKGSMWTFFSVHACVILGDICYDRLSTVRDMYSPSVLCHQYQCNCEWRVTISPELDFNSAHSDIVLLCSGNSSLSLICICRLSLMNEYFCFNDNYSSISSFRSQIISHMYYCHRGRVTRVHFST